MVIRPHYANRLARGFTKLMGGEASAGVLLIAVAILAIAIANSNYADDYHSLFHHHLGWTPIAKLESLHAWINDALMAVFFFVVGLEIKREVLGGALSDPARRRLPIVAAAAGMAAPALVYVFMAGEAGGDALRGWAIPAATDIAFALGVLGLLGRRVPPALRLFLLTVAIVDDLGAVLIIALFYTAQIEPWWALGALGAFAALVAANRLGMHRPAPFLLLGLLLWVCVLHSGIHATIAGVLLALTIPYKVQDGDSMLLRLEHALVPWNSYVIVPLFGFANAGVALAGLGPGALLDPVPLGIALGLFLGKPVGVLAAIALCDRLGLAARPAGTSWVQLWGMATLCGIGFTMSLFIGALAFPQAPLLVEEAKLGVLAGSLLSSLLGFAILRLARAPAHAPA